MLFLAFVRFVLNRIVVIFLTTIMLPVLVHSRQCSAQDLKESFSFLNDYLGCIAGHSKICNDIVEVFKSQSLTTGLTGAAILSEYSYHKIRKELERLIVDSKKLASDSQYAKRIAQEVGGPEIDEWIKKNGGANLEMAKKKLDERLKRAESMKDLAPDEAEEFQRLQKIKRHVEMRLNYQKENLKVLNSVVEKPDMYNQSAVQKIIAIEEEANRLEQVIARESASKSEKEAARKGIKNLRDKRSKLVDGLQSIDTRLPAVAEKFNPTIDAQIDRLRKAQEQNPQLKRSLDEAITALQKRRIVPDASASAKHSRLYMRVTKSGYSVGDINGPSAKNPAWVKDLRESAFRDFPSILLKELGKDPSLRKDFDPERLLPKLAEGEHERWRKYTQDILIDTHE